MARHTTIGLLGLATLFHGICASPEAYLEVPKFQKHRIAPESRDSVDKPYDAYDQSNACQSQGKTFHSDQPGQLFADTTGVAWEIRCSKIMTTIPFAREVIQDGGFGACMVLCSRTKMCNGWGFSGDKDSGICNMMSSVGDYMDTAQKSDHSTVCGNRASDSGGNMPPKGMATYVPAPPPKSYGGPPSPAPAKASSITYIVVPAPSPTSKSSTKAQESSPPTSSLTSKSSSKPQESSVPAPSSTSKSSSKPQETWVTISSSSSKSSSQPQNYPVPTPSLPASAPAYSAPTTPLVPVSVPASSATIVPPLPGSCHSLPSSYTDSQGNSYNVTCGTDYPGHDVGAVFVGSFSECFQQCGQLPACQAFSFLGKDGPGYCYFKNAAGSASARLDVDSAVIVKASPDHTVVSSKTSVANPTPLSSTSCEGLELKGQPYTDSTGSVYTIDCSYDYSGNDIASVSAPNFEACYPACSKQPGCVAFSYLGTDLGGNCYLKGAAANGHQGLSDAAKLISGGTPAPPKSSTSSAPYYGSGLPSQPNRKSCSAITQSGELYNDSTGQAYRVHCSTDHQGGDLTARLADSFADCMPICDQTAGCVGFAFVGGSGAGVCYLKSSITNANVDSRVDFASKGDGSTSIATSSPASSTPAGYGSSPGGYGSAPAGYGLTSAGYGSSSQSPASSTTPARTSSSYVAPSQTSSTPRETPPQTSSPASSQTSSATARSTSRAEGYSSPSPVSTPPAPPSYNPQPYNPQPYNPQPAESKPAEPKPVQPKPAEPKPTEPRSLGPQPGEPKSPSPQPYEPKQPAPQPNEPKSPGPQPGNPQPYSPQPGAPGGKAPDSYSEPPRSSSDRPSYNKPPPDRMLAKRQDLPGVPAVPDVPALLNAPDLPHEPGLPAVPPVQDLATPTLPLSTLPIVQQLVPPSHLPELSAVPTPASLVPNPWLDQRVISNLASDIVAQIKTALPTPTILITQVVTQVMATPSVAEVVPEHDRPKHTKWVTELHPVAPVTKTHHNTLIVEPTHA